MVLRDTTKKLNWRKCVGYIFLSIQVLMYVSGMWLFRDLRGGASGQQIAVTAASEAGIVVFCILEQSILRSEGAFLKKRPILYLMMTCALYMYAALLLWLADERPALYVLAVAANSVYLMCPALIGVAFWRFLVVWFEQNGSAERLITKGVLILAAAYCAVVLVNIRFGCLFTVDRETGVYARGGTYPMTMIVPALILLVSVLKIFTLKSTVFEKTILLMYLLLPYINSILWAVNRTPYMTSTITFFVIVFLYSNLYVNRERALAEHKRALEETRTNAMLLQINPHFIYNTLGSIDSLCATDPDAARDLIQKFSMYLQSNYRELTRQPMIPFSEELENLRIYLSIEQVRFPSLKTEFDIRAGEFMLPALSVQPLAENAVKHGICQRKGHRGTLTVSSWETEESFCVSVRDDGVGFDPRCAALSEGTHLGIRNVTDRLALLCGGTLSIQSTPGEGTECVITIPKEVRG